MCMKRQRFKEKIIFSLHRHLDLLFFRTGIKTTSEFCVKEIQKNWRSSIFAGEMQKKYPNQHPREKAKREGMTGGTLCLEHRRPKSSPTKNPEPVLARLSGIWMHPTL